MSAEGAGMAVTSGGLIKRSFTLKPEQMAWLEAEAERLDRDASWVLRDAVQTVMDTTRPTTAASQRRQSGGR